MNRLSQPAVYVVLVALGCAAAKKEESRDVLADLSKEEKKPPGGRIGFATPSIYRVAVPATAPVLGPRDAKVTIVVFSEFQCPFCARHRATLKRIRDEFPGDVRIVFRHNPLAFHARAFPAAIAALAAGEQGKFWEMYDLLFDNQRALEDADLIDYAKNVGLSEDQFRADLIRADLATRVKDDQRAATTLGARGVPASFVNGRHLSGAQPFETLKQVVEEERARANQLLKTGVSALDLYDTLTAKGKTGIETPRRPFRAAVDDNSVYRVPTTDAPWRGPKDAKVTIVVYSDFQCPFCARVNQTIDQVLRDFPSVKFVFRHLPLPFHVQAKPAARAAWAAWQQGKFWEMHDLLFANFRALDPVDLERYAGSLGLDVARWKQDMESAAAKKAVDEQIAEATRFGRMGTPTFFVNGKVLVGAQPYDRFAEHVKKATHDADALIAKGVKLADVYDALTRNGRTQRPTP